MPNAYQSGNSQTAPPGRAPRLVRTSTFRYKFSRWYRLLCLVAISLAIAALVGWWRAQTPEDLKESWLATLGLGNPMVPSTATLLLLIGIAALVHGFGFRFRRIIVSAVTATVSFWCCGELLEPWLLSRFVDVPVLSVFVKAWEHSGMSVGTALSFLFTVVALWMVSARPTIRWRIVAGALSGFVLAFSFATALAQISHAHDLFKPFYFLVDSRHQIRVALPTSLVFLSLSFCISYWSARTGPLFRPFLGDGISSTLLRSFLPIPIFVILIQGFAQRYVPGYQIYLLLPILFVPVWYMARRIGRELKAVDQQLRIAVSEMHRAKAKAEEAATARDMLLAQVSHELRTPLTYVLGSGELLELEPLPEHQRDEVRRIIRGGKILTTLVDDILNYQKLVLGQMPLKLESFAIQPVLQRLASDVSAKIAEKRNTLIFVNSTADGQVYADQERFCQIISNLLSNAAKFTNQGTITIRESSRRMDNQDWAEVSVADTGLGILPQDLPKLFKPFCKILDRKLNPSGTGLGLAICQLLAKAMGGTMEVKSTIGLGTTMTCRLPARTDSVSSLDSNGAAAPSMQVQELGIKTASADSNLVLVIDDDPEVGALMRKYLEKDGFAVEAVSSGAQAVALAEKKQPGAITLDILMPGLDGWATLAALKANQRTSSIPVVMVSILGDVGKGMRLGAAGSITKPIDWGQLTELLTRFGGRPDGGILIVDDDPDLRSTCRDRLMRAGWKVIEAENGQAALTCLSHGTPSLILLDLGMPIMDGFQFLEQLANSPHTAAIPVVVLTGRELTDDDRRRLRASVQSIVEKHGSNLESLISKVLEDVKRLVAKSTKELSNAQDSRGRR